MKNIGKYQQLNILLSSGSQSSTFVFCYILKKKRDVEIRNTI